MIVITLTNCPHNLRGDLTKWLQEINTGVYVGRVSARVRDEIWQRVKENAKSGTATLVFSTNNEQRMDFRIHNTNWEPIDYDGLKLILRPSPARLRIKGEQCRNFSNAAKTRKAKQMSRHNRNKSLLPETYVVVDLETTGLSPDKHEIIEIGAVMVKERQVVAQFQALVQTQKAKIPPSVEKLTGLTDEILESEGKELAMVMQEFLEFTADHLVVSHNASFDYQFIRYACECCNLPLFLNRSVDTVDLSRRLIRDIDNYKLTTLLENFGIEAKQAHRCIDNCLATHQLYVKLIEIASVGI